MINWDRLSAREVRERGRYITSFSVIHPSRYGIYIYKNHIIQIHENDGDIAAAWDIETGKPVYLHPVTKTGLEKVKMWAEDMMKIGG